MTPEPFVEGGGGGISRTLRQGSYCGGREVLYTVFYLYMSRCCMRELVSLG